MPTSRDVARRAGVSQSVVSYVLSGARGVSPERRARVLAAIEELGYRPSASARALRHGHSNEIVAALPDAPLFLEILDAMRQCSAQLGYVLRAQLLRQPSEVELGELVEDLHARRPAGVVTVPRIIAPDDGAVLHTVRNIYCIYIHTETIEEAQGNVPMLPLRVFDAAYLAARHLIDRRHHHLGLIVPILPERPSRWLKDHVAPREAGMHRAIAESHGAKLTSIPMHRTLEDARRVVAWLQEKERPTGIYAFNDIFAFHLLAALYEQHIRVPEQVALVGTDDTYFCQLSCPALTSIRFDDIGLGRRAVEIIDALRKGKPLSPELTAAPTPSLIHRRSS
jgi:DNA-binding LacI/PurR family transcriptional regulator